MILVDGECHYCYFFDGLTINDDNVCEEVCGDGIFLNLTSECDDNNIDNGDGCSSTCTVEYGYHCDGGTECREVIPPTLMVDTVSDPNVVLLEFDEEVFLSSNGNKRIYNNLDALTNTNMIVKVTGPLNKYTFNWRILNFKDIGTGKAIKYI